MILEGKGEGNNNKKKKKLWLRIKVRVINNKQRTDLRKIFIKKKKNTRKDHQFVIYE